MKSGAIASQDDLAPDPLPLEQPPSPPSSPPPLVVQTRHQQLTSILATRFEELEAHVSAEHEAILQIVAGGNVALDLAESRSHSPPPPLIRQARSPSPPSPPPPLIRQARSPSPPIRQVGSIICSDESQYQPRLSCGEPEGHDCCHQSLPGTLNMGSESKGEEEETQQACSGGSGSPLDEDLPVYAMTNGSSASSKPDSASPSARRGRDTESKRIVEKRISVIRFNDQLKKGCSDEFSDVVPPSSAFAAKESVCSDEPKAENSLKAAITTICDRASFTSIRNSSTSEPPSGGASNSHEVDFCMAHSKSTASVITGARSIKQSEKRERRTSTLLSRSQSEMFKLQRSLTKETGLKFSLSPVWEDLCSAGSRPSAFRRSKTAPDSLPRTVTSNTLTPDEEHMQEYDKKDRGIHQPNGPKRLTWDLMGMILIIYDLVFIPLQFFEPPETDFDRGMGWITRIFWTLDMPASSLTGFFRPDGTLEMRFRCILTRYLKTWFLLDIVVNGSDWAGVFFGNSADSGEGVKTVRAIRILRMVRLLRVLRMPHIFNAMMEHAGAAEFILTCDILKITSIFLAVTHLIACCWYAIGLQMPSGGLNWVSQQLEGAEATSISGDLEYRYLTSLHWSVTQFIGSMEVRCYNWLERVFACMVLVFAFVLSASFVSSITSAMTRHHISATRQTNQLSTLRRYLNQNKISQRLLLRVTRNAQFAMAEQQRNMPEGDVELLALVSDPLLMELHYELYAPWMVEHPFFELYSEERPEGLRKVCHHALTMKTLSIGDVCFTAGEGVTANSNMMFVTHGTMKYTQQEDSEFVSEGAHLCEGVLWTALWTHQGTLRAVSDCKVYIMNALTFQDIAIQYEGDFVSIPDIDEIDHLDFSVGPYAMAYVDMVNSEDVELSDIGDNEVSRALVQDVYMLEALETVSELPSGFHSHRATVESDHSASSGKKPFRPSGTGTSSVGNRSSSGKITPTNHNKTTWDVVTHTFSWLGRSNNATMGSSLGSLIHRFSHLTNHSHGLGDLFHQRRSHTSHHSDRHSNHSNHSGLHGHHHHHVKRHSGSRKSGQHRKS